MTDPTPTPTLPLAGLARDDLKLLAELAGLQADCNAAGLAYPVLDNALASLRAAGPGIAPAATLAPVIDAARRALAGSEVAP